MCKNDKFLVLVRRFLRTFTVKSGFYGLFFIWCDVAEDVYGRNR